MSTIIDGSASVTINSGAVLGITSGTAVASTSGTSIDFTSIPSWVKRITVMFNGVSTNGTSNIQIQLGTSGGVQTTSYSCTGSTISTASVGSTAFTSGFVLGDTASFTAASFYSGSFVLTLVETTGNTWTGFGMVAGVGQTHNKLCSGAKPTTNTLDRVRITTVNGTDTFDAGSINILYEG
jgi:hypothetical protein